MLCIITHCINSNFYISLFKITILTNFILKYFTESLSKNINCIL